MGSSELGVGILLLSLSVLVAAVYGGGDESEPSPQGDAVAAEHGPQSGAEPRQVAERSVAP